MLVDLVFCWTGLEVEGLEGFLVLEVLLEEEEGLEERLLESLDAPDLGFVGAILNLLEDRVLRCVDCQKGCNQ